MFSANASQVSNDVKYIEDFCSVYLRTGTGSSQTVTTGVKENTGALVISKSRSAATDWAWYDTFRGATYDLVSNSTAAQTTQAQGLISFNADGHTWGTLAKVNTSGATYVDTVLKPTPKFFDVVTYTGDGTDDRIVSHNLGSVPGFVAVKATSATGDWWCYHRSAATPGVNGILKLNTADAVISAGFAYWGVTSTTVNVSANGAYSGGRNAAGVTYVMYLFAHNAGGFGLTGTDNVISCGSYTGNGALNSINLGYEAQYVLIKSTGIENWVIYDNMRGMAVSTGGSSTLYANLSNAEATNVDRAYATATGFAMNTANSQVNTSGQTYIYIAIRRGPMKVPTDGTKVFAPVTATGTGSIVNITTGFPVDLVIDSNRTGSVASYFMDRLRGGSQYNYSQSTAAEGSYSNVAYFDRMTNYGNNNWGATTGSSIIDWCFRRAPGFFDEVCYTGTGVARTVAHNLGVAPELMIVKTRNDTLYWEVYAAPLGATKEMGLNSSGAAATASTIWNNTEPTSSVFTVGTAAATNGSGKNLVAYLFASCPGVSKVGSYTGTGATQTINCGFTGGARFVLIKRTDNTGSWFVYDTARGMTTLTDPYLLLNSTAAESATLGSVTTVTTGFAVNASILAAINTNGASYIFLAIA